MCNGIYMVLYIKNCIGSGLSMGCGMNCSQGSEIVDEVSGLPPMSSVTLDNPPSVSGPLPLSGKCRGDETSGIL